MELVRNYPLVVFEGIDGSGKTTLRNVVWDMLLRAGVPTIAMGQHSFLDPNSAHALITLRNMGEDCSSGVPWNVQDLYVRDKFWHWRGSIGPALEHAVVILDRYFLSDAVYLQALYGLDLDNTLRRARGAGIGVPDLLVYLDIDEFEAEKRVVERGRETRHYERAAPLGRVRREYLATLDDPTRSVFLARSQILRLESRNKDDRDSSAVEITSAVRAWIDAGEFSSLE